MASSWERYLERWTMAGLIEAATADRVRVYEREQGKVRGLRWPIVIAVAFAGLLFAAGILLFVAAHWDGLSETARFTLVLTLVAVVHLGGAIAGSRFAVLSTTLHAVGTVCLGAGIYLTGQIFHLQEHWPAGMMLWAIGAWAGWVLLRDWTQAGLAAVLTPAWLAGEWAVAAQGRSCGNDILAAGLLMVAITYLGAVPAGRTTAARKVLLWIGGIALIPVTAIAIGFEGRWSFHGPALSAIQHVVGWGGAFLLPLALAWRLRGRHMLPNVAAAFWVAALIAVRLLQADYHDSAGELIRYGLCALGSVGLIAWGVKEGRRERVNLGIAGFALTVLVFYFSTIMDKLGRSASLIGLGFIFLLGGWLLEKARRRLMVRMGKGGT